MQTCISETGSLNVIGRVQIYDHDTGDLLMDKRNAIHPQNMSRILSKALANEANSSIYRIAFGNGGTTIDPTGTIIFNPPNDGSDGSWESRLYNETYSEVIDESSPFFGTDPGSAEPGSIRTGGGAQPDGDPSGSGIFSQEVGDKSNVVITAVINRNEPSGQLNTINDFGNSIDPNERRFIFDEIGLYSFGKPAAPTNGYSSVNVGNKTSESVTTLLPNVTYLFSYEIDGVTYNTSVRTPDGGTGIGNTFTYGDLCEGLNTGLWIIGGDIFSDYGYVFITDRSEGSAYPSITDRESYGFLTFQSLTTGSTSFVNLVCTESDSFNLMSVLTGNVCGNVNINQTNGSDAGIMNDPVNSGNERERLLSHLVFPPITKAGDTSLRIVYTLTISISRSNDSKYQQVTTTP